MDNGSFGTPLYEDDQERAEGQTHTRGSEEEVERRLASYAFVREERDGEVRLTFRDVPPAEIALAFRAAGAILISISGERLPVAAPGSATTGLEPAAGGRKRRKAATADHLQGEALLRYFFSLGEIVYTASLPVPSGVVGTIAGVYPSAALNEHELNSRLGVVFTP